MKDIYNYLIYLHFLTSSSEISSRRFPLVSGSNLYTHIQKYIVRAARTSHKPSIWNADLDIDKMLN